MEAGHSVALLSAGAVRDGIAPELPPGVLFLAAGAMPGEFSADAARRTGADVFHPTPAVIGKIFGGSRLDLGGARTGSYGAVTASPSTGTTPGSSAPAAERITPTTRRPTSRCASRRGSPSDRYG